LYVITITLLLAVDKDYIGFPNIDATRFLQVNTQIN